MKHRLNLNNYTLINNPKEADIIITPFKSNGKSVPDMFLRRKEAKDVITDTSSAIWTPTCHVAIKGTIAEYQERVEWWFQNISIEYMQELFELFGNSEIDLTEQIENAKQWLIRNTQIFEKRKESIGGFLYRWLKREFESTHEKTNNLSNKG
jgi:hypothetical protein